MAICPPLQLKYHLVLVVCGRDVVDSERKTTMAAGGAQRTVKSAWPKGAADGRQAAPRTVRQANDTDSQKKRPVQLVVNNLMPAE